MRRATDIALVLALASCGRAAPSRSTVSPDTVVQVNGAAITEAELAQVKTASHDGAAPADPIDTVVDEELAAQRARELGLDRDPAYQAEVAKMEAPLRAFERQRLSEMYYQELARSVKISDDDARAYYDAHAAAIATELHVEQIATTDRAALDADASRLAAGASFDDIARAHYPADMPPGRTPWDVGFLRWNQIPDAWNGVVDRLAVGETSGVIAGPRGRFWIVRVIERRPAEHASYADVADVVKGILSEQRVADLRQSTEADLRASAQIVRQP